MKRYAVLLLSLLALVASASAWLSAQAMISRPIDPPLVLSGSDVAVRVEAWQGNTAVGKLLVRVDGRWVEVAFPGATVKLSH